MLSFREASCWSVLVLNGAGDACGVSFALKSVTMILLLRISFMISSAFSGVLIANGREFFRSVLPSSLSGLSS